MMLVWSLIVPVGVVHSILVPLVVNSITPALAQSKAVVSVKLAVGEMVSGIMTTELVETQPLLPVTVKL